MTVIVESGGEKIGFLIEDKIDAIAMPEQHGRYIKRETPGRFFSFHHGFSIPA